MFDDARSKRVVVLAHCLLNQNAISDGTADLPSQFDEIVEFSEIGRYLDQPVKNYSSGMYARLAFSVAAFLPAEVMLIDEVLSVGDADFREKAQRHMKETLKDGRTVVYVGHQLDIVRELTPDAVAQAEALAGIKSEDTY